MCAQVNIALFTTCRFVSASIQLKALLFLPETWLCYTVNVDMQQSLLVNKFDKIGYIPSSASGFNGYCLNEDFGVVLIGYLPFNSPTPAMTLDNNSGGLIDCNLVFCLFLYAWTTGIASAVRLSVCSYATNSHWWVEDIIWTQCMFVKHGAMQLHTCGQPLL